MTKSALLALVVVLLFVLLILMVLGWYARRRRQSSLPAPRRLVGDPGAVLFTSDAFYVATTTGGDPLDRIAVGGLGFRARAGVSVTSTGVVLTIPGQDHLWIPTAEITGVDRATWTIDRVVEQDGLVLLAWQLPGDGDARTQVAVDSYFRFDVPTDAELFITTVSTLLSSAPIDSHQGGTA
jgi:hypothetical protein